MFQKSDFEDFAADTAVESPDYQRENLLETEIKCLVEALRDKIESKAENYVDHNVDQML